MRSLIFVFTALGVFALAFWAYRENYATQQVLRETRDLELLRVEHPVRLGLLLVDLRKHGERVSVSRTFFKAVTFAHNTSTATFVQPKV